MRNLTIITRYITFKFQPWILLYLLIGITPVLGQAPAISYQTPNTYLLNNLITQLGPTNIGGPVPAGIYGRVTSIAGSDRVSVFLNLTGVAADASGNLYVAVWAYNRIEKVTPDGTVSLFAGNISLQPGYADGQGSAALFDSPGGLVTDAVGNLYVSEQGFSNRIRKITPGGLVSTLAGSGSTGSADGTGTAASFNWPRGLAIDAAGNILVVDQGNNKVRKITPAGVVSTIAGTGGNGFANGQALSATFSTPTGVGVDPAGNLFIADAGNGAIRKMSPTGIVTTVATGLRFPREVRADNIGNLFVTEQDGYRISRISATGQVTTVAGGQSGHADGIGDKATLSSPIGLLLDKGSLFFCDNFLLRKVDISGYAIDKPLPAGMVFDPTTGVISGTPTELSFPTNYTVTAYNGDGTNSTLVNIEVVAKLGLKPSIITFPLPVAAKIGPDDLLNPEVTSTNKEVPITYTSSNPLVAYIQPDGRIKVIAPGVTIITAFQQGNDNYSAASPVSQTFTITQEQLILFPAFAEKFTCQPDFDANAVSTNSTIPLSYNSSNTAVATISSTGIIHIVSAGTTTITASQGGNELYIPAPPAPQLLTIKTPIVPQIVVTPDKTSVCTGTSVIFTATVSNLSANLTYQWQVNGANAGSNSPTFTTVPVANDRVLCQVINPGVCPVTGVSPVVTVTVNPYLTPSVMITSSAAGPVCGGTEITFTATPVNGGSNPTYRWQVNGVDDVENTATFKRDDLKNGDAITCAVINNSGGCLTAVSGLSNSIKISIIPNPNPAPSLSITESASNNYVGTPILFTAIPANAGTVINYQWQVNDISVGGNSSTYSGYKFQNGDVVTCIITSNVVCSVPTSSPRLVLSLVPAPIIQVTNTFTPNGDGRNDTWEIPALMAYASCQVSVYDRSGMLVFQSRGYHVPWDGTSSGKSLPYGTYYYLITIDVSSSKKLSGSVAIIR